MGLDMYICKQAQKYIKYDESGYVLSVDSEAPYSTEIAYFRKFNALHNFFNILYREIFRGTDTFNCVKILIDDFVLDKLQEAVDNRSLTPVEGFFFGSQEELTDDDYDSVQNLINTIKHSSEEGYIIYYDSWW